MSTYKTMAAIRVLFVCILAATCFSACDMGNSYLLSLRMDQTGVNVLNGESKRLRAIAEPDGADLSGLVWTSADPAVATVGQDGTVTGIKAGMTTVTARSADGNKSAGCAVAVWGRDTGSLNFAAPAAAAKYAGWSFWLAPDGQSTTTTLADKPVRVTLAKDSGSKTCGYGFLFGYVDDANYYKFLIDGNQKYYVSQRKNGVDTVIYNWFTSSNLNASGSNTIEVKQDGNGTNRLVFNGQQLAGIFSAEAIPNKVALYAAIDQAGSESFPVAIHWNITSPITFP